MNNYQFVLRMFVYSLVCCILAAPAAAQTFSNPAPINTPNGGAADLYPSPISVSGVSGPVSAIVVSIPSFATFDAGQAALMLVSPSGGKVVLMRECGISSNVSGGIGITFNDLGPALSRLTSNFVGGTFRPTVYSGIFSLGFPSPAPEGPYATTLGALITGDVNGTWSLYVADLFSSCCPTSLPAGWQITFLAGIDAVGVPFQGKLENDGSPVNGVVDLRFRLLDASGNAVGLPCNKSAVPVSAGVFTTNLNQLGEFGPAAFQTPGYLAIETSVRNPADPTNSAPFVTLSPSTPLAMVPFSQSSRAATFASQADSVPWTGITGVPASVSEAFSPWAAATGGINYAGGRVGIGTAAPATALHLNTGPVGSGWQLQLTNSAAAPTFESGMRTSDAGFFEITNRINGFTKVARLDNTGAWTAASDARLKADLSPFGDALEAAMRVRPVRFKWIGDGKDDFGVIAQELRSVLPEAVTGDESKDSLTANYSKLAVVAIGAIQEQQAQIISLREQNNAKQRAIEELRARLERLERAVEKSGPGATRP
mgnify:FL=1